MTESLFNISPLDGRYAAKLNELRPIVSEFGLMKYRLKVEINWLIVLANNSDTMEYAPLNAEQQEWLLNLVDSFSIDDAKAIKAIEANTNHDVKAIEYFIREKISTKESLKYLIPLIHFGCTSEDINNLAYALMVQDAQQEILIPNLKKILIKLENMRNEYHDTAMLSRTHGQSATPTTLGKEIQNVLVRLQRQLEQFKDTNILGKFNGAVGNFNAHQIAYPELDWLNISKQFIIELGLSFNAHTTQIEPHDYLAELLQNLMRINTILIDLNRDLWGYISLGYFQQERVAKEVGSSTMPHKVNPIDFENSEGNLGIANALANHLANKLPISRWQRDLSDSTVLRNLGNVFGHSLLAYFSTLKGLNKLRANINLIENDLANHWEVLAEAIQSVMRRYGIPDAYEQLKDLTRGEQINQQTFQHFIQKLTIPKEAKERLLALTPHNYLGLAKELSSSTNEYTQNG